MAYLAFLDYGPEDDGTLVVRFRYEGDENIATLVCADEEQMAATVESLSGVSPGERPWWGTAS